ncbi:phage tail tape measure protein [Paenibacillus sp. RC84]|uniref:phage tail tape measure protein n=1 Tax=Paenibacillus sp. RC84 TaxID=3156252 RepID=UPI0035197565
MAQEEVGNLVVRVGLDGTGFQNGVSGLNRQLKVVQSEFQVAATKLGDFGNSTEGLKLKADSLTKQMELQKQKVDALQSAYDKSAAAKGTDAKATQDLEVKLNKAQAELNKMDTELKQTSAELKSHSSLVAKLGKDYQESFDQAKLSIGNSFDVIKKAGVGITAAGAGIAVGLGGAVSKAADFEQAMSNVKAVMAPDEIVKFGGELQKLAIQMGADTKYSATEAAKGIEELVKAGVSTEQILSGGLSGALSLATAGELELADAAEIASTALNAFRDDNLSVMDAADILAGAANASATSVGELKFGLSAVSAVAAGAGLSFMDTSDALAVFAQNGLKGSDAGTSLKTMIMNLQPSTRAQTNEFDRLGLITYDTTKAIEFLREKGMKPMSNTVDGVGDALRKYVQQMMGVKKWNKDCDEELEALERQLSFTQSAFFDSTGSIKSMSEIAELLKTSLSGLNDAQRLHALEVMFGSDAIRAANILYKEGADGVNAMADAMKKVTSEQVAAEKMNNLKGAVEQLSGSFETAMISIGNAFLPMLKSLAEGLGKVTDAFNGLSPTTQTVIAVSAAIAGALALIAGPILMIVGMIPMISAGFAALSVVAAPIGIIVGIVAALAAGAYLVITNWGPIKEFFIGLWEGIKSVSISVWEGLKQFFSDTWAAMTNTTQEIWNGIKTFFMNLWNGLRDFLTATWNGIKSVAEAVWNALSSAVMAIVNFFVDRAMTLFNNMKEGLSKIFEGIKMYFTAVWDIIKNIFLGAILLILDLVTGNFEDMSSHAEQIWNNLKDAFGRIWEAIKLVFSGSLQAIGGYVKTVFNEIKTVVTTVITAVTNFLKTAWDAIYNAASTAWNTFYETVSSIVKKTVDWIRNEWNAMLQFFSELPGKLKQYGIDMFNSLRDGISSVIGNVKTAVVEGMQAAIDFIKDLPNQALQWGKDIINGMINGIKSKMNDLRNSISDMVNSVKSGITGMLGINSPSRVTTEYGQYTTQGFAIGMAQEIGRITNSARQIAAAAIPQFNRTTLPSFAAAGYPQVAPAFGAVGSQGGGGNFTQNITINSPKPLNPAETARQNRLASRQLAMEWRG